ncbi:hypothetical protein PI23P_04597 [Polaribacter irgensii 23-P]|uniref:Phage abortive infection protein n=1 Tax=Polaribacter irgensii 23-P TaxID=313594 RepID=A4BXQ6_9FLAO|nr:putative phage abortive infection protein [Polaribacter irgensii]EAR13747.1 hypothetical protein PI23P_04597 [Polaribacter irgensii 23-P]
MEQQKIKHKLKTNKKMMKKTKLIWMICFVLIIIITLALNWCFFYNDINRGTFGDMFGAANALFSGLAFAGIIYTILLQREDLKSTKEEFKIQQFETNLYNLINSHLKIVEQLGVKGDNGIYIKGREVFRIIYETKPQNKTSKESFDELDDLGHYFRNIYRILKIISREEFKGTEDEVKTRKYRYSNLLRSLLSNYELKSILFWCIQEDGKGLIKYINEYTLFKDLSKDLKDVSLHTKLEKEAFETPERFRHKLES